MPRVTLKKPEYLSKLNKKKQKKKLFTVGLRGFKKKD